MNKFFETCFDTYSTDIRDVNLETQSGRENLRLLMNSKVEESDTRNKEVLNGLNTLNASIYRRLEELDLKIVKTVEKVRGAILAERATSGAIYTTQIPINNQQKAKETTTRIEDGIAYGVPQDSEVYSTDLTLLKLSNLSFKNLNIKKLNKMSTDLLKDFSISPHIQNSLTTEFSLNLSGVIKTNSSLVIDMKNHAIVEIYRNGELFKTKALVKNIIIPVDSSISTITIRSYQTIHRTSEIVFNKIGYTELLYTEPTLFETKNINIGKDLSQIVVDTCDNSNNQNIEIKYYISINDDEWESFSPTSKHNGLEKQSIITVDKSQILKTKESKGIKVAEGNYRFEIPSNLQSNSIFQSKIYLRNNYNINEHELILFVQNDTELVKAAITGNESDSIYIDNRENTSDTVILYKGIRKLLCINNDNNISSVDIDYINNLIGSENVYIKEITKDIIQDSTNDSKYISLSYPEFKDSFSEVGSIYFTGIKPAKTINTIKLKAELRSLDQKTVPFVSRILLRGV